MGDFASSELFARLFAQDFDEFPEHELLIGGELADVDLQIVEVWTRGRVVHWEQMDKFMFHDVLFNSFPLNAVVDPPVVEVLGLRDGSFEDSFFVLDIVEQNEVFLHFSHLLFELEVLV